MRISVRRHTAGVAVTQQLARLPLERLGACRASVADLDAVCSLTALASTEYLDLNWAPAELVAAAVAANVEAARITSLRRAFEGDFEVNPEYREVPDTIWEQPVNAVEPGGVAEIAHALREIPLDVFERFASPHGLPAFFTALLGFYETAAQQGLAIAMWWD